MIFKQASAYTGYYKIWEFVYNEFRKGHDKNLAKLHGYLLRNTFGDKMRRL